MRETMSRDQAYLDRYLHQSDWEGDLKEYKIACQRSFPETADMYAVGEAIGIEVTFGANHVTYLCEPIPRQGEDVSPDMPGPVRSEPDRYSLLTIAAIENITNGANLDLLELLPDGWRIFVDNDDDPDAYIFAAPEQQSIVTPPNFIYGSMILDLAHEVGHAQDTVRRPELFVYPQDPFDADTLILNIKKERAADAYATRIMKKFMSEDARGLFNPEAFREYNNVCRQYQINERLRQIQARVLSQHVASVAMHRPTFK